jgi:hypothetical protein
VPPRQRKSNSGFQHFTNKVITIGGEAGTMAFVDLQHGILQYDVFTGNNLLRYTMFLRQNFLHRGLDAVLTRDIAIVDGWFKFVEVVTMLKQASDIGAGWKVTTWSMDAILKGCIMVSRG